MVKRRLRPDAEDNPGQVTAEREAGHRDSRRQEPRQRSENGRQQQRRAEHRWGESVGIK